MKKIIVVSLLGLISLANASEINQKVLNNVLEKAQKSKKRGLKPFCTAKSVGCRVMACFRAEGQDVGEIIHKQPVNYTRNIKVFTDMVQTIGDLIEPFLRDYLTDEQFEDFIEKNDHLKASIESEEREHILDTYNGVMAIKAMYPQKK